jgi:outer membrane lipase/esterase
MVDKTCGDFGPSAWEFKFKRRKIFGDLLFASSVVILLVSTSASTPTKAQQFSSIQAFGDSYADTGNLSAYLPPRLRSLLPLIYPTGRFSGGTNYVDTLSALLGIPQTSYAIGGAETGTTNTVAPGIPGFTQEWSNFIAGGGSFTPSDLLVINIGGDDARAYYQDGGSLAGVPAASAVSATQAMNGINALVGAGARTIVFTAGDVGQLPEAAAYPATAPVGSAYSQSYNSLMQQQLGALAATGVRIEYVDIGLLAAEIAADPARYGIANAGACPSACVGNSSFQNQYLFYVDGVHPTSAGFTIIGEYIVNRLNAPLTFSSQGDMGLMAPMSFVTNMSGRLDLFNAQPAPSTLQTMASANPVRNRISPYILVNGSIGSRDATSVSNEYDWNSTGGTVGIEYRLEPNAMIGAALNYADLKATQLDDAGSSSVKAYQFGLYGAWTGTNLFAQGIFSYGLLQYANDRPGVVSTITSSPSGSSIAAVVKAGYLFDAGARFRFGPIVGLIYLNARVNGYSETGDPVLTLALNNQTVEALIGSAGGQLRYAFPLGLRTINTFLNLTAENDFLGEDRVIQYNATSAPLIVNTWTIPGAPNKPYGRVSLGATMDAWTHVAVSFDISQTFARAGGNDFTGMGGIKLTF